jgi:two-component system, chemotaxis family, protein-glutamate methylesterase/glutaminase
MKNRRIVALGASLGGLAAFEKVLRALPKDFDAPVILVQHRRQEADSRLCELLQRRCELPICEPEDRTPLEPGRVYLAPAGYHLLVDREVFFLSVDPPVSNARPSIDVLFDSLAAAHGEHCTAIMLTGASDDGAEGARAIKRAGGRVFVQNPETAHAPTAPRSVLAQTEVDGVLELEAIGELIAGLKRSR